MSDGADSSGETPAVGGPTAGGDYRTESDLLGEAQVEADALYGVHTVRALENFPLTGRPVHGELVRAYGTVKLAAALPTATSASGPTTRPRPTPWSGPAASSPTACSTTQVVVEPCRAAPAPRTNMNVNEVLANRALELLGEPHGAYERVSPLDDVNLHQSHQRHLPHRPAPGRHPPAARAGGAGAGPAGGLPGQGEGVRPRGQGGPHRSSRTRCSPPWAARWAPTPRRSTATAGASTSARSACAWSTWAARPSAPGFGRAAPVHLPGGRRAARAHRRSASRAPRTWSRPPRTPTSSSRSRASSRPAPPRCSRSAPTCACSRAAPRPAWARSACRPARPGSSIMPGKVNPVIPEAVSQAAMMVMGYDATHRPGGGRRQPGAQPLPAAGRRLPAREPAAARARLPHPAPPLRRGHRRPTRRAAARHVERLVGRRHRPGARDRLRRRLRGRQGSGRAAA